MACFSKKWSCWESRFSYKQMERILEYSNSSINQMAYKHKQILHTKCISQTSITYVHMYVYVYVYVYCIFVVFVTTSQEPSINTVSRSSSPAQADFLSCHTWNVMKQPADGPVFTQNHG